MAPPLHVLIVGGGLGGLATAIALRQKNIKVTVLEGAQKLGEVGAGIQVPPNSVRQLQRLGVDKELANASTWPGGIHIKRWKDGANLSTTRLGPVVEKDYGSPYWLIHRADFHAILHKKALEVGVNFLVNCFVTTIDAEAPSVTTKAGRVFEADIIIGADGVRSCVRSAIIQEKDITITTGKVCVYRCLIPGEIMNNDPELAPYMHDPNASWWVGPHAHVMAYPIRNGKFYNFNLTYEGLMTSGDVSEPVDIETIRERYVGWDPIIEKMLTKVASHLRWGLFQLEPLPTWVSSTGKVALLGDAAHAMLPFLAQGAAMAIEDAVVLAECLSTARNTHDVPMLLHLYEQLRKDRVTMIQEGSQETIRTWHLPDGPQQRARDCKLQSTINMVDDGPVFETRTRSSQQFPNSWNDPVFQPWLFGFDAIANARTHLEKIDWNKTQQI